MEMSVSQEFPVFHNPSFIIKERTIRENDSDKKHLFWDRRHESFVVMAAITPDEKFVFVQEPKYGALERIMNLPTGGVEPNELPDEAAKRELLEETGYKAREIIPLRGGIIDFPNKIAGGVHSFFLGLDAAKVSEPQESGIPILVWQGEIKLLIAGKHPDLKLATAMSISCLSVAIFHLGL